MDIKRVSKLQKKTELKWGVSSSSPCRPMFKALKILMVAAQYILSLMTFLAHNLEYFTLIQYTALCTRRRLQPHRPAKNLASYQKSV